MKVYETAESVGLEPGDYLGRCVRWYEKRKGKLVILTFVLEDGKYDGVALKHWMEIAPNMTVETKFGRAYKLAGGKSNVEVSFDVFLDKLYVVRVGWRNDNKYKPEGGDTTQFKKDDDDYLRVHLIISLFNGQAVSKTDQGHDAKPRRVRALKPTRRGDLKGGSDE